MERFRPPGVDARSGRPWRIGEERWDAMAEKHVRWIALFAAIAAASSSYSAYKIYLMTDGKPAPAPAKGKR